MWNYLIYFYPMEDLFANRMEIFCELINLVLMYHLLLFTDFVQDVTLRYWIGYSFIGFMMFFICVHLYFMLKDTIKELKHSLKKKCSKKNQAEKQENAKQKQARILSEGIKTMK